MGEEAFLEMEPYSLYRVQLGRVGRQRHQRNVDRHSKSACAVPAGLIEHHRDMLVVGKRRGKSVEELLHRLRIHVWHDERKAVVGAGLDGREDVGEREALVAQPRWALAAPPPDVTGPPLLSDPRLILEEQTDALVFMRVLNCFQKSRGSF